MEPLAPDLLPAAALAVAPALAPVEPRRPSAPPACPADPDRFDAGGGFVLATGIECSAPLVEGGVRQDELRLTGHWERFAEDVGLVASLGLRHLRYGIPFHVVAADPDGPLDWAWTDRAMGAIHDAGIEPVADLLHFAVPDDLAGFGDPRLPARYRRFVEGFLRRYPWVRRFTPVNEPLITARFSAEEGWWNERRTDQASFVAAIGNVAECAVDGMALVRSWVRDPVFLQSDGAEAYAAASNDPRAVAHAAFLAERRFVGYDLAYGREPAPVVLDWLLVNGLDARRLARLLADGSDEGCIVGLDYYVGNEHLVDAHGAVTTLAPRERRGFAVVAREYHDRLRLPFMLAETNRVAEHAVAWLEETWADTVALRDEGLPIRGYCWYSLTDQVDWDTCLRVPAGHVDSLGLVDLDRRMRPVGERYRELVAGLPADAVSI